MTASGDGSAHIWKAAVIPDRLAHAIGGVSSEESADSESEDTGECTMGHQKNLKSPVVLKSS